MILIQPPKCRQLHPPKGPGLPQVCDDDVALSTSALELESRWPSTVQGRLEHSRLVWATELSHTSRKWSTVAANTRPHALFSTSAQDKLDFVRGDFPFLNWRGKNVEIVAYIFLVLVMLGLVGDLSLILYYHQCRFSLPLTQANNKFQLQLFENVFL